MNVFLLGATGYIGRVVAEKLQAGGHEVMGLARSEAAADMLRDRGIAPHRGDVDDPAGLIPAARRADAVIFAAFAGGDAAARAMRALLDALAGTDKAFLWTSGSGVVADLADGEPSDRIYAEDTPFAPDPAQAGRVAMERQVRAAAGRGVRAVVLRPPLVYGRGGSFQVPTLIEAARASGEGRYIGRGANVWSTVHLDDLADLYVLALDKAAPGELFNTASGEADFRSLAEAISRMLGQGGRTRRWTVAEAGLALGSAFGAFGAYVARANFGSNSRITGEKARATLGWRPRMPSIFDDIEQGSYQAAHAIA